MANSILPKYYTHHAVGDDYTNSSTTVTFNAGDGPGNSRSVFIDINDDDLVERAETFSVFSEVLAENIPPQPNGTTATVNIIDPDGMFLIDCLDVFIRW